jgi:hypothetical protein
MHSDASIRRQRTSLFHNGRQFGSDDPQAFKDRFFATGLLV